MTIKFLQEQIEKNARVILPEFGAFLVKDDGSGVFKPENITFSPFLRYNDGMLEDALSIHSSLSKDESAKRIKKFVEMVKEQLLNENKFPIEGLGSLYRDNRGSVHFSTKGPEEKTTAGKMQTKSSTTSKIEAPKQVDVVTSSAKDEVAKPTENQEKESFAAVVNEKKEETKTIDKPITKPAAKPAAKKPIPKPNIPQTKHAIPKPQTPTPVKPKPASDVEGSGTGKAILIGSLIGVSFVVLLAGGWYLINKGYFSFSKSETELVDDASDSLTTENVKHPEEVVATEQAEQKGEFDSEFDKISKEMDKSTQKPDDQRSTSDVQKPSAPTETRTTASAETKTAEIDKVNIPTSEGPYHLIVGSFRNKEYADKFSDDMKKSGYNSTVVVQSSGMHAVTLGSYSTRQDALNAMDQFKNQHPSVWLLTQ